MAVRRKAQKSIIVRLLVLGVSVYMIVTLAGLFNDFNDKRIELNSKQQQLIAKESEIEELKKLLDDGSESQIIEKAARERLGYVYSDEQVFLDISGD